MIELKGGFYDYKLEYFLINIGSMHHGFTLLLLCCESKVKGAFILNFTGLCKRAAAT